MYWNYNSNYNKAGRELININMRCIEITGGRNENIKCDGININMRCIEITLSKWLNINSVRLTLTWDVLKLTYTSFVYAFIVD